MVVIVPLGATFLTALLPVSATYTLPAPSTATPEGWLNPAPIVVVTSLGCRRNSVCGRRLGPNAPTFGTACRTEHAANAKVAAIDRMRRKLPAIIFLSLLSAE